MSSSSSRLVGALALVLLVAACAGRDPRPVSVQQSFDRDLSCDQLRAEQAANSEKGQQIAGELNSAEDRNVAIGVVGGLLFWPALFALDLSDAEDIEMKALEDRNAHLARLEDRCIEHAALPEPAYPVAPAALWSPSPPGTAARAFSPSVRQRSPNEIFIPTR